MRANPRQIGTPVLVEALDQPATSLEPMPLDAPPITEDHLQRLLAYHPELLPITELLSYRLSRVANALSRSAALRYRREFDVSLG